MNQFNMGTSDCLQVLVPHCSVLTNLHKELHCNNSEMDKPVKTQYSLRKEIVQWLKHSKYTGNVEFGNTFCAMLTFYCYLLIWLNLFMRV